METVGFCLSFRQMVLKQKIRTFKELSKEVLNFPKILETVIECSPYLLATMVTCCDYWQLPLSDFISESSELCFLLHCVGLLFTEPSTLVATRFLLRARYQSVLSSSFTENWGDHKQISLFICECFNEKPKQNKRTKKPHSVVPCAGEPPLLMVSIKFSACTKVSLQIWKTECARISQTPSATYQ